MDYIFAHIPYYSNTHRQNFIANKMAILQTHYPVIYDEYGDVISWDVIEYYLILAYNWKYYGRSPRCAGLRLYPDSLLHAAERLESRT